MATTEAMAEGGTRERLIVAALDLIREGGEEALSMRALGEQSGLSRGAPYRHFDDKDALIEAIAAAGLVDLGARTEAAVRRARGSKLSAALVAYAAWAIDNPDWYRVTFQSPSSAHGARAMSAELAEAGDAVLSSFASLVADAQVAGELPEGSSQQLVGLLWASVHGAIDLSLAGHGKPDLGTADPRRFARSLLALLAPR